MQVSTTFSNGIKLHGIQTGTVSVKPEHFAYSGLGLLRIPKILLAKKWMPEMPIWVWLIESPSGNFLIDTGESTSFYDENHFSKRDNLNRKIVKIKIKKEEEIHRQLARLGFTPAQIDAVILTHMHIDHIDGVEFFSQSEFFASQLEWEKPFGVPLSVLPKGFKPSLIQHSKTELPFVGAYRFTDEISLVSTPGHTLGHQSVLLDTGAGHVLLAGDTSFNEEQLKKGKVGGISLSIKKAKQSLKNIGQLSRETSLVYLPSHDPESGKRLVEGIPTLCE